MRIKNERNNSRNEKEKNKHSPVTPRQNIFEFTKKNAHLTRNLTQILKP